MLLIFVYVCFAVQDYVDGLVVHIVVIICVMVVVIVIVVVVNIYVYGIVSLYAHVAHAPSCVVAIVYSYYYWSCRLLSINL